MQVLSLIGEAAVGNVVREIGKNFGLQTLFESAETSSWFQVSDPRAECAITSYHIYHTSGEELTAENNAALWARLDGANYGEDGLVKINTDITEAELTIQDFFIAARAPLISDTLSSAIQITLSCINLTDITTTYGTNSVPFVVDYTLDSHLFKIFVGEPGISETIDLSSFITYETDRPDDCDCLGVQVTDASGTLSSSPRFSTNNFVLTVATDSAFYGSIYLKATTYVASVFKIDKVLVTVCGDQTIVNIDQSNPVFDINGNATDTQAWTVFNLKNIWKTTSATFADNECPITSVEICEDVACTTLAVEADGVRISTDANGDFQFELDKSVFDADPEIQHWFKVSSFNKFIIEPFSVELLDCTDQVVSLTGDALAPINLEIGKNKGVLELLSQAYVRSLFAVSDPREACGIYHYRIFLTTSDLLSATNDAELYGRL